MFGSVAMFDVIDDVVAKSARLKVFPGQGVPHALIEDAERELGIPLPDTYKAWLLRYGNLSVGDTQVFTLAPIEDRDIADDDLVYNTRLAVGNGFPPLGLLPVFLPGSDEAFYFDTRGGLKEGEYPVVRFDHDEGVFHFFSPSFLEFMITLVHVYR